MGKFSSIDPFFGDVLDLPYFLFHLFQLRDMKSSEESIAKKFNFQQLVSLQRSSNITEKLEFTKSVWVVTSTSSNGILKTGLFQRKNWYIVHIF